MLTITPPTPDLALNAVLDELVRGAQAILGDLFTGAYLQGSFATGGWDAASDVDLLIVVERELPEAEFCQWLTSEIGVAAIPLSAFYGNGFDQKVIRFCFAKKDETLKAALERLARL